MVVVASFSADQPAARTYAVGASAVLLLAFAFSTAVALGAKELMIELFSYVLTGLRSHLPGRRGAGIGCRLSASRQCSRVCRTDHLECPDTHIASMLLRDFRKDYQDRHSRRWYILEGANLGLVALLLANGLHSLVNSTYSQFVLGTLIPTSSL